MQQGWLVPVLCWLPGKRCRMGRPAASAELAVDLQDAEKARASLKRERYPLSMGVVNAGDENAVLSMSNDNLQVLLGKNTNTSPSCGHKPIGRGVSKLAAW